MLELKLVKENLFLNVLEAILDLFDVASVDCSSKGLKLQAVDTEHVAIISLLFPDEEFEHYHCDEDLSMGIAIDDMVKAIRCADKDDTITIKIGNENFETITLSFKSPENDTRACDLPLVDNNSQRFHIPDWQVLDSKYQAFVEMPSAEFMRACKYLSIFGDYGDISVSEKGLTFFASGKSGHVDIKYMQSEKATGTVVTLRAPISLTLDLKYMNSLAKASTLFNQVKIGLSTTHALVVKCKIGKMGYMRYFLAPMVKPEIEEEEIEKRKRSKRNGKDEGSTEEKEGSAEEKEGSAEEKEGSKEIKESGENKEGPKRAKMKGSKREGERLRRKRRGG